MVHLCAGPAEKDMQTPIPVPRLLSSQRNQLLAQHFIIRFFLVPERRDGDPNELTGVPFADFERIA
jgi:hypothetical protein